MKAPTTMRPMIIPTRVVVVQHGHHVAHEAQEGEGAHPAEHPFAPALELFPFQSDQEREEQHQDQLVRFRRNQGEQTALHAGPSRGGRTPSP